MKKAIISAFVILSFAFPATFAQVPERCVQYGWVKDNDPKGTNVRNAPSINGKVIEVIEPADEDIGESTVDIIGYQNGWLKIKLYDMFDDGVKQSGTGWISAKKVTMSVETNDNQPAPLYAQPSRSSRKVGSIPIYSDIEIVGYDCFGLKVSYKGTTGWLSRDDTCGNPLTTCP